MIELIKKITEKPRVAGTPQCDKVKDFLAKQLECLGYETKIQKVPFVGWKVIEKPKLILNGKNVNVLPVLWSGSTKGNVKGTLRPASPIKTFEAYKWLRWKIVDKSNKIKGYIITRPDTIWLQLVDKKSKLPYFMVYPKTYKEIKDEKNIKVEASVESKFITNQSIYNIITKESGRGIVVCAHYDSMLSSPGANDNATGVNGLIETAKKHKDVQYILFSAEEWNKYGSYSYVRSLKPSQLKKIKLLINLDMFGHGKPYCICSKRLARKVRSILPKSVSVISEPRPPFDFWPFYKKGVGIVHFGASPYEYCHNPKDTIDKLQIKPMRAVLKYVDDIISAL